MPTAAFQRRCQLLWRGLLATVGCHGFFRRQLQPQQGLRHAVGGLHRVDVIGLLVQVKPPVVQRRFGRHQTIGTARAQDHAIGHFLAQPGQHVVCRREHSLLVLEQAARASLQDEGLQVAAPQTGMHDVGRLGQERRDFGAVLARAELG